MNVLPLPYDMGDAGDFIKHGMLAEFVQWWLESEDGNFVLVDPFGGRPYAEPPHPAVIRRLARLPRCALSIAQPHYQVRYYGSGNVVRNIAQYHRRQATVLVSDRDPLALEALIEAGFQDIQCHGFDRGDSFSIIDSIINNGNPWGSLLLLDPYDDFLPVYAARYTAAIANVVISNGIPVLLFVLYRDRLSEAAAQWQQLRQRHFTGCVTQLSLMIDKMPEKSNVKGEASFHVEALLLLDAKLNDDRLACLCGRLRRLSQWLGVALHQHVSFQAIR